MKRTISLSLLTHSGLGVALATTLFTGCATKNDAISQAEKSEKNAPGIMETKAIAEEGFIYGLPIVMNYAVMYEYSVDRNSGQFKAPFNQILNEPRVFTYKDTAIITPNSDTPYSLCWLDLRAEPIVLSVPAVEKSRYFSVMLCDGNCFNYGYMGSRATGNEPGDYLVVGPDWKGETPAGIKKVFRSTTQFSLAAYRTQLINPADMPNVIKVQSGYKVQPLSAYLHQPAPPAAPAINFPPINKEMVKTNFFQYLDFALQFAPPGPEEKAIRAKLARIGVGAGKNFSFDALDLEHKLEVLAGLHQFVAGKEGTDAHTAANRQFRQAGGGGQTDVLRAQADAGGQDVGAECDVFTGGTNVFQRARHMVDDDTRFAVFAALLHDDRVGAFGNRRAGEDAGGSAGLQRRADSAGRNALADRQADTGSAHVGDAHGVAIHRRIGERRHGNAGLLRTGEHAAGGGGQRHAADFLHRLRGGEQLGKGLFVGQHGRSCNSRVFMTKSAMATKSFSGSLGRSVAMSASVAIATMSGRSGNSGGLPFSGR